MPVMCDDADVPDKLLTTPQAAAALGIGARSLARWAQIGDVRPAMTTPGGRYLWDLDQLRAQISTDQEAQTVTHPSTEPEPQPVVAAIVTSPLGVLAGRRNDGKPPWTFIAGEIEPGESQADAAVREVKEETGLLVIAQERELGRRIHPKTGRTMIYLACAPTNGLDVFVGDEDELAEVRWLSLVEADELLPGMFPPVHAHLAATIGQ